MCKLIMMLQTLFVVHVLIVASVSSSGVENTSTSMGSSKELADVISYLKSSVDSLQLKVNKLESALQRRSVTAGRELVYRPTRETNDEIAVYAYLSASKCLGAHQVVVFDHEETDTTFSYNTYTGIFTVPMNGLYAVSVTAGSDFYTYFVGEIVINGIVKGLVLSNSEDIHDRHTGSTTIIFRAMKGDVIFVRRATTSSCTILSDWQSAISSISIWKIN
ncbi:uncharacterized protein LOC127834065 isoform X2 [Dreissena polymorpha]|uniref:uncharacterized protein LOC127834065 isoform X2 n=1 Tax=Dreissena polymorpha TaxID=45954 RepID=UPI0022643404|nr:uncharacterized protein LOC127834065 isoform X2 [Dreissena polymorpha]